MEKRSELEAKRIFNTLVEIGGRPIRPVFDNREREPVDQHLHFLCHCGGECSRGRMEGILGLSGEERGGTSFQDLRCNRSVGSASRNNHRKKKFRGSIGTTTILHTLLKKTVLGCAGSNGFHHIGLAFDTREPAWSGIELCPFASQNGIGGNVQVPENLTRKGCLDLSVNEYRPNPRNILLWLSEEFDSSDWE